MRSLIIAAGLALSAAPAHGLAASKSKPVPQGALLNLNCMSALAAVGEAHLAGVFTFISEKDSAAAFAELLVRDKSAFKKYRAKLEADMKAVNGVSVWDHEVLLRLIEIYASPLAGSLEKPGASMERRINELSLAPTLTLEEMTGRRGKP